ncbi:hypothetical protein L7F22_034872 [Adiantum nelumboides]|nr:hypothetical protein [Adiantum nelumboides]
MEAHPSPPEEAPPEAPAPDSLAPPGTPPLGDGGPVFCLVTGLRDGFAGGVMGSVFGFDDIPGELPPKQGDDDHMIELIPGQGLWKKQGFKGSLKEAGSSAKMFALLSGVHTLVTCCLRKIRGKQDAINAGIAGCATGLALSTPGNPEALLRSCVTFAAFSYIMERFSKPPEAIAGSLDFSPGQRDRAQMGSKFSFGVLPPFVLPPAFLNTLELSSRGKVVKYTNLKNR